MNKLYPLNEKELLFFLKNNNQQAFECLYNLYSTPIYRRILRLTRSESIADELLQDTFVKVWEKRGLINEELSFKAWLYRIAENEVFMFYRKLARDKRLQEHITATFDESHFVTERDILLKESREILNKAIEQLPFQCRQVFTLCKMEGKSYEETGNILGISPSTVSNHLVKASKYIRSYIFESEKEHVALIVAFLYIQFSFFFN